LDADSALVTAQSLQMRLEIVSFGREKEIKGKLYSKYLDTPYEFSNLVQVTKKMDKIFDTKNFPEAFVSLRSFGEAKSEEKAHSLKGRDGMELQTARERGGVTCTFEISVKFRQNATWQGQILWAEKNLKKNFRSVLEMIKLMDQALADGEPEEVEEVGWDTK